jgi:predicted nucleic acid-binding protein
MYLIDTDVISEARKGVKTNPGVRAFFGDVTGRPVYLSAITIGELRQGIERLRYRADHAQAERLERWLARVSIDYGDSILAFDADTAEIWGRLRVPNPENPLDKQVAATALIYDLTVVTRNVAHYATTGVQVLNPFS